MSPLSRVRLNGFFQRIFNWCIASLPSVRITSKIYLLTTTLTDKDNSSSDALLSDNLSNGQDTFIEGQ